MTNFEAIMNELQDIKAAYEATPEACTYGEDLQAEQELDFNN